jgi:hypothetical protein
MKRSLKATAPSFCITSWVSPAAPIPFHARILTPASPAEFRTQGSAPLLCVIPSVPRRSVAFKARSPGHGRSGQGSGQGRASTVPAGDTAYLLALLFCAFCILRVSSSALIFSSFYHSPRDSPPVKGSVRHLPNNFASSKICVLDAWNFCMGVVAQTDTFPDEMRQRASRDDKLLARAGSNRSYRDRLVQTFDEQACAFPVLRGFGATPGIVSS